MKVTKLCDINGGQDGVIWGNFFMIFHSKGVGWVYDFEKLKKGEVERIASFDLDKIDVMRPHCNSVVFGNEYYEEGDEFPLVYCNVYNNYQKFEEKHVGVCCVYRLQRNGLEFKTTLVQIIKVGFVEDSTLWCSETGDFRPYGNFVVDREKSVLYAFNMRDQHHTTRYFAFKLPKGRDGVLNEETGVRWLELTKEDLIDYFDTDYHNFMQGATMHNGKIYSVEGFTNNVKAQPAIRIINPETKELEFYASFMEMGYIDEAEFIDFTEDGKCYYENGTALYELEF
jgi:hypothetical protein